MNKYQEALDKVRENLRELAGAKYYGSSNLAILQELVDKEKAMEVVDCHHCPKCEANVSDEMSLNKHYCSNCG